MKPIKDRTYRSFCAASLIIGVLGMCIGIAEEYILHDLKGWVKA